MACREAEDEGGKLVLPHTGLSLMQLSSVSQENQTREALGLGSHSAKEQHRLWACLRTCSTPFLSWNLADLGRDKNEVASPSGSATIQGYPDRLENWAEGIS